VIEVTNLDPTPSEFESKTLRVEKVVPGGGKISVQVRPLSPGSVAVMREGSEVALFMYGLVASAGSTTGELVTGSILGLASGVGVTVLTYLGLATIPQSRLFAVTTALISFLAAGLAAQAVLFLQQAGS
jgi:hypothetical protein